MTILVYLTNPIRCWTLAESQFQNLRDRFPEHQFILATNQEMAEATIGTAQVYWGWGFKAAWLKIASDLRWVATPAAGLEWIASEALKRSGLTITRGGFHGKIIAESVLAMMLYFERRLAKCLEMQHLGQWDRAIVDEGGGTLAGKTLGVIGAGNIGAHIAEKAKCLGMRVLGVSRRGRPAAPPFDRVVAVDRLEEILNLCDHIVLALPSTAGTRHLIGKPELARMKPTAYFYNVGRGACVDTAALTQALAAGAIAGAGLDVFEEEPLPADSPLRAMPNVLVTPHASAIAPQYLDLAAEEFAENLRRFDSGQELLNIVAPESELWLAPGESHSPAG